MDLTHKAVSIFNQLASEYERKFMDVSLYGDTFAVFCHAIEKENATLLEVACGPGNITHYLLQLRPDLTVLGTDLAPNMIAIAQKNNPSAAFQLLDCREMLSLKSKYDAIMCGFGLPYLSKKEAIQFIADASKVLNPNGVLYLSTMEDDHSKSRWQKGSSGDEIFMNYHEAAYLKAALEAAQFKVIAEERKSYHYADGTPIVDLVLIAKK